MSQRSAAKAAAKAIATGSLSNRRTPVHKKRAADETAQPEAEQPSVAATPKATDSGNSIETLAETTPGKRGRRWGAASAAAIFVEPSDEEASEDGSEDT
eukprot:CAMPEP_0206141780 /NCGR_PEP_ID=MMETSP1473-20131121/14084_1 /ASSEMBLY_ACC=CAM_ASM_001109 /TAXON_ID=1461547 /ORGANISM="Stichococcus sp, Strain RCC1054" /LENGTH=98 /DNA_ID=CAMNT_0053536471 /DNA_START=105 /DNA_END=398 /DNA_ORIENTATION=-